MEERQMALYAAGTYQEVFRTFFIATGRSGYDRFSSVALVGGL